MKTKIERQRWKIFLNKKNKRVKVFEHRAEKLSNRFLFLFYFNIFSFLSTFTHRLSLLIHFSSHFFEWLLLCFRVPLFKLKHFLLNSFSNFGFVKVVTLKTLQHIKLIMHNMVWLCIGVFDVFNVEQAEL